MTSVLVHLVVFALLLVVLCLPPAIALTVLVRRYRWCKPGHQKTYRLAIGFAGLSLAVNLLVSTFDVPPLDATSLDAALGPMHLVALGLSWLCLWGALTLGVLVRRRRRLVF